MANFVETLREIINPELKHGQEIYSIAKKLIQNKSLIEDIYKEEWYTANSMETRIAYLIPVSENSYRFSQVIIAKLCNVKACELDPPLSKESKKRIIENDSLRIRVINKDKELTFSIRVDKNGKGSENKNEINNLDKFLAIANQLLDKKI
jgi:hypothetical protein